MRQSQKPQSDGAITPNEALPDIVCSRAEMRKVAAFWAEFTEIKKDVLEKYGDVDFSFDRTGKRLRAKAYGALDGDRKLLATITVGKTKGGITWEI